MAPGRFQDPLAALASQSLGPFPPQENHEGIKYSHTSFWKPPVCSSGCRAGNAGGGRSAPTIQAAPTSRAHAKPSMHLMRPV